MVQPRWGEYGVIENGNDAMGIMDSTCERGYIEIPSIFVHTELSNFLGILLHYSFVSGGRTAIESVPR
jgi:hypothetical protein